MKRLFLSWQLAIPFAGITLLGFITQQSESYPSDRTQPINNYTEEKSDITGLWIGEYTVNNNEQEPQFYSLSIFPDGVVMTRSSGGNGRDYYCAGSWKLENDQFKANILTVSCISFTNKSAKPVEQVITAKIVDGVFSDATWSDKDNSGKFQNLARVNAKPCDKKSKEDGFFKSGNN